MKRLMAMLLCLALLAALVGCGNTPAPTDPPETTVPPTTTGPAPTAAELYAQAADALRAKQDLCMSVTYIREMKLGVDTFKESIQQEVTLRGIGTDAFCAKVEETWYNGSVCTVTGEVYTEGKLYCQLNDDRFSAEMTAEDYLERLLPALMLDESLYETVEQDGKDFTFTGATALEGWVDNPYAQLISAEGTVRTDGGNITESAYKAQFTQGSGQVDLSVTVKFTGDAGDAIQVPDNGDQYILHDTPDGPALVRRVIGYLLQADSVESNYLETGTTDVGGGMICMNMQEVYAWGRADTQAAKTNQSVQVMGLNGRQTEERLKEETYMDGILTTTDEKGKPVEEKKDPSDVRGDVEYGITASLPGTLNVTDYSLRQIGDALLLEYNLDADYSQATITRAIELYLDGPSADLENATRFSSREAKGVLCLDAATLMPLAATLNVSGSHTVDGEKHTTTLEQRQDFLLGGTGAYEAITGEPLPEETPENKPTPLFYHVTGAEGQEMWLLGTIHIGDVRTKHLPQEIYDAFDASDALALEFESDAFYEQAESDPELMAQIRKAYLYSDGTLLDDHISDTQLYDDLIRMLKVTGQYNQMMALYKPYFLAQMIDGFLRDRTLGLNSDYGVDFLLEDRANEQDKEILSVETGLSQIQMLANFSDELQEHMLYESLYYGHVGSNMGSAELYEMWCQGDATVLRECINEDDSDLTEEEKLLVQEYNQAVSTDRNIQMTQVAIGYLESGDTVFYAVGLAHLLANGDGLVDALREAGYTVEPVTYN